MDIAQIAPFCFPECIPSLPSGFSTVKVTTWIVLPLMEVTTSPGFVAFPLGMFSVSGIKPMKANLEINIEYVLTNSQKESVHVKTLVVCLKCGHVEECFGTKSSFSG